MVLGNVRQLKNYGPPEGDKWQKKEGSVTSPTGQKSDKTWHEMETRASRDLTVRLGIWKKDIY